MNPRPKEVWYNRPHAERGVLEESEGVVVKVDGEVVYLQHADNPSHIERVVPKERCPETMVGKTVRFKKRGLHQRRKEWFPKGTIELIDREDDIVPAVSETAVIPEGDPMPSNLEIMFNSQTRKFVVKIGDTERIVRNGKDLLLLPGDVAVSGVITDRGVYITQAEFKNTDYIAGYVAKEADDDRYYFYTRWPEPNGTFEKFKYPTSIIPDPEAAHSKGDVVLIDRKNRKLIVSNELASAESTYEGLKRIVLTTMGAYDYSEKAARIQADADREILEIARTYGVKHPENEETIDAELEPTLSRLADTEAKEGTIEDMRDTKGGRRQTFYIDPHGSRDHDDALSIEDLEDGSYEIGIHIADVARYVKPGGALDFEAAFKGSSFYLDDEVIRMLPSLLSEHLASLNAGQTRFAFSLIFTARLDKDKHVRITNIRLAKTAIKVTEGLTYNEAARRAQDKSATSQSDVLLRTLLDIGKALNKRRGIRSIGEDASPPDFMGFHEMVAEFMLTKSRFAGSAYERMKRAPKEPSAFLSDKDGPVLVVARPHLRRVQDLVLGTYRVQELKAERDEQSHMKKLFRLGVLVEGDLMVKNLKTQIEEPVPFKRLAQLAYQRIQDGGFYKIEQPTGEQTESTYTWVELRTEAIEDYYRSATELWKNAATYSTEPEGHFSMGGVKMARITSPIRRYVDLMGQRKQQFQLKLVALQERSGDISEAEANALMREYMEEVVGLPFVPGTTTYEKAQAETREEDVRQLAHSHARERLGRRAEGVVASLHTAVNVYEYLGAETERQYYDGNAPKWDRNAEHQPQRVISFDGTYENNRGEQVPEGIVISFADNIRIDNGEVYGEILISERTNAKLLPFVPGRIKQAGARLKIKFKLPPDAIHPVTWAKQHGIFPPKVKVSGAVVGVQVEQGRLVFELAPGGDYLDPRTGRPGELERERRGRQQRTSASGDTNKRRTQNNRTRRLPRQAGDAEQPRRRFTRPRKEGQSDGSGDRRRSA